MFKGKVMISRKPRQQQHQQQAPPPAPPVLHQGVQVMCSYPHRVCMQNRLAGYEYCIRHILEDKSAPYKQCNYIYPKNGKRCTNAASKLERKEGCCPVHANRGPYMRQRAVRKRKPPEMPESLVEELDHYNVLGDYFDVGEDLSKELPPTALVQLPLSAPVNRISRIIDYTSDSDSDYEPVVVDQTWRGTVDSDAESVDSEYDDPLKHAGVYTAEETTLIARDKLTRLQSLYIEQFKRLHHELREKRRRYLHALKQEKESFGGSCSAQCTTPKEVDLYKMLKASHRYHRKNGVERLLHSSLQEKRKAVTEGQNYRPPAFTKCVHPEKDKKCGRKAMPYTKYCVKHILNDGHQLLYKPCGSQSEAVDCSHPTIPVFGLSTCINHCKLPPPIAQSTSRDNPASLQQKEEPSGSDQLVDPLAQPDDMCGSIQASDFPSDLPNCSLYGDAAGAGMSGMAPTQHKGLWSTSESKIREELDSIDLTPGDLPPEQLLATS